MQQMTDTHSKIDTGADVSAEGASGNFSLRRNGTSGGAPLSGVVRVSWCNGRGDLV